MAASPEKIFSFAIAGHGASGKTTLMEQVLHKAGATTRVGSVDDGTSHLDFLDEEKDRKCSIAAASAAADWKDRRLSFIDTPGFSDFFGEVVASLAAVDCLLLAVSAGDGIKVTTNKTWNLAGERGLPRLVVVTKLDGENLDLEQLLGTIKEAWGASVLPVNLPDQAGPGIKGVVNLLDEAAAGGAHAETRRNLIESIVELDDDLMNRYLEEEKAEPAEIQRVLRAGIAAGKVVPLLCVAARAGIGVEEMLDFLAAYGPSPVERGAWQGTRPGKEEAVERAPDPGQPVSAFVYRTITDPFVGKLSCFRVVSGTLTENAQLLNSRTEETARIAPLLAVFGKEQKPVKELGPGEFGAVPKLEDIEVSDTLCAPKDPVAFPKIVFPKPMVSLAVEPKSRGDEQKIAQALSRLASEDHTFQLSRDASTGEQVVSGLTNFHLEVMLRRMKQRFAVEVNTKPPKIPYRETVSKAVEYVEYTHKKQTGGAGQYARVFIDLTPAERGAGYEFQDKIVGGVIDQSFRPSVDKGIKAKMAEGVLAGYPVVDVNVALVDGKTHPVDSKDIAFQIAGREAFKKAFMQAGPVLLEPIVTLEVTVPTDFLGDVQGHISGKRGRILGLDSVGQYQVVRAEVPLAEVANYATDLRSMTGGQGEYTMDFARYETMPPRMAQAIIDQAQKAKEEK